MYSLAFLDPNFHLIVSEVLEERIEMLKVL